MDIHSLKRSFYSALVFFGTLAALSVGYATLSGGLTTADKVGSGSGLTAVAWNRIVDGVLDINTRLENFSFSSGNVGIGMPSPISTLSVKSTNNTGYLGGMTSVEFGNSNYWSMIAKNNGYFYFGNDNGVDGLKDRITFSPIGNIGIWTTTPAETLTVGAPGATGNVKIGGRGAFALAAEAACLAAGNGGNTLVWSPGTSQTCAQACAPIVCGGSAGCVSGWTLWPGDQHYRYGNECTVADPSAGQSITGKYCCCNSNCAQPLYSN